MTKCLVRFLLWLFSLKRRSVFFHFSLMTSNEHTEENYKRNFSSDFCVASCDKTSRARGKKTKENLIIFTHSSLTSYFSFSFFLQPKKFIVFFFFFSRVLRLLDNQPASWSLIQLRSWCRCYSFLFFLFFFRFVSLLCLVFYDLKKREIVFFLLRLILKAFDIKKT